MAQERQHDEHTRPTQETQETLDTLELLACDLGVRPSGAPPLHALTAAVRLIRREGNTLLVDVDPAAAEQVAAVVEAERRCCAGIGWHLEGAATDATTTMPRLRIEASPAQLTVLARLLSAPTR